MSTQVSTQVTTPSTSVNTPLVKDITHTMEPKTDSVTPIAEPDKFAEQFQRIAKQEKYISAERQKLDEARKSLESTKLEAESYKSLKGKTPFEILEHFGITYDKLLEADKMRTDPISKVKEDAKREVESLRNEISRKEQEAMNARLSKAEVQLKSDIDHEIRTNEYDLIEHLDAKDAVKDYMEEIYNTTGEIPSVKDACDAVTAHLVDRISRVKESKWLKPKEPVTDEAIKEFNASKPEAIKSTTLSNKMVQSSTTKVEKPMTDAERMAAAKRAMASIMNKK